MLFKAGVKDILILQYLNKQSTILMEENVRIKTYYNCNILIWHYLLELLKSKLFCTCKNIMTYYILTSTYYYKLLLGSEILMKLLNFSSRR